MPFSKQITWLDAEGNLRTTPRDEYDRMKAAVEAVEQAVRDGCEVDIETIVHSVNGE